MRFFDKDLLVINYSRIYLDILHVRIRDNHIHIINIDRVNFIADSDLVNMVKNLAAAINKWLIEKNLSVKKIALIAPNSMVFKYKFNNLDNKPEPDFVNESLGKLSNFLHLAPQEFNCDYLLLANNANAQLLSFSVKHSDIVLLQTAFLQQGLKLSIVEIEQVCHRRTLQKFADKIYSNQIWIEIDDNLIIKTFLKDELIKSEELALTDFWSLEDNNLDFAKLLNYINLPYINNTEKFNFIIHGEIEKLPKLSMQQRHNNKHMQLSILNIAALDDVKLSQNLTNTTLINQQIANFGLAFRDLNL